MQEIRTQSGLQAFYRFASKNPDAWKALEGQRLEHRKFGSGKLEKFIPTVNPKHESAIDVRFDASETKRLAVGPVFDNGLFASLTIPLSLVDRFRTFVERENWKEDWHRFEAALNTHGVKHLYHFTDVRNLDSIREYGGLYSYWGCKQKGIEVPAPGSDRNSRVRDQSQGLQDYVRLGFNQNPPMLHIAREAERIKDYAILEVDPSVAYLRSTCFSNINANDGQARVGGDFETFEQIRLHIATRRWEGEEEKRYFQAEVLVEGHVPLDFIENL